MKKIVLAMILFLSCFLCTSFSHAVYENWISDGPFYYNNNEIYEWFWSAPPTVTGNIGIVEVDLRWTEYGRMLNNIPSYVKDSIYFIEVDTVNLVYRYDSSQNFDYDGFRYTIVYYPNGNQWFTINRGSVNSYLVGIIRAYQ